jgi:hypothetical protein
MNDMTDLVSSVEDMDKVMNEIYALVRLNAEAESHAEDLFEQLKEKILTHKIDRDGFEKHALHIKCAICIGRNYTEKMNDEVLSFKRLSTIYEIGKKSKALRKKAKDSEEKVFYRKVMKIRENMLDKAGSMYRRWLLKLFPVEAVNVSVSAEVAVAVSQSAAARDIETLDPGSQSHHEPTEAQGSGSDNDTVPDTPPPVNNCRGDKRVVVQTTRFVPGDGEGAIRKSLKRGRSESTQPPGSKKRALMGTPEKGASEDTASPLLTPIQGTQPHIIFIDTNDGDQSEPSQDYQDIVIRVPKKAAM